MPIKQSAKKYMRITERRTERNKSTKGVLKSAVRKTREAAQKGEHQEAKAWFVKAQKALDKAVQKNIMKKNTAARRKSRLSSLLKKSAAK